MKEKIVTLELKFDREVFYHYDLLSPGTIFILADEGDNGNIYVKSAKKGNAPHNLTRPGIMVWPDKIARTYIRVF